VLESPEPVGEQVRTDPRKPGEKVLVALRTEEKLADEQECPAFADDIESPSERAVLVVGTTRHLTFLMLSL